MKRYLKTAMIAAAILMVGAAGTVMIPKFTANKTIENTVAKSGITVHYKWKDDVTPHFYYTSVDGEEVSMSYPGVPMEQEAEGWYSYTVADAKSLEFKIILEDMEFQTANVSCEAGEYWFDEDRFVKNATEDYLAATKENGDSGVTTAQMKNVVAQTMKTMVTKKAVNSSESITIHYTSEWNDVQLYAWNALPKDVDFSWPGKKLEKDSDGYYSYTFSGVSKVNFLFSNGTEQSEEFALTKAGEYTYQNGEWVSGGDTPASAKPTPTGSATTPAPFERSDFRDETIYFVITTRFYDGDTSNNVHCSEDKKANNGDDDPAWRGDFKGLIEKLDYIKSLGFSAVWITPVVENRSGYDYHGYHAYDFSKVDSRYESADTSYQDLINAAHAKGMKIIQDVVFNHTCNWGERNLIQLDSDVYSERNQAVMNGSNDPDNIYHHNGFCGGGDWDNYSAQDKTIADDCFDLETENPKVYNYLVDCYKKYIAMGVDGFRVDTVKHISRLTLNSVFLPAFKEAGGDNFYMFGEVCTKGHDVWYRGEAPISTAFYTWADDSSWTGKWSDDMASNESLVQSHYTANQSGASQPTSDNAFLNGNEYHQPDYSKKSGLDVIDFQMHWSFNTAIGAFNTAKGEDQYFNDSTWNVVYVDSHDYGPDECQTLRYNGGTDAWAENLDLMFTFRGIPCLYYGSEIEFQAGKPIDVGPNAPLAQTGRAYFGDNIEGSVNCTDFATYSNATGAMAETLNSTLAKHIQRLNLIRRAVPALRKGQYSTDGCNGNMAFKRRYTDGNTDSFACVTISGDATFSGIPSGTYVDMITGDKVECNGTLTAKCSGKGNMRVYVLQTAGAPNSRIGENGNYLK